MANREFQWNNATLSRNVISLIAQKQPEDQPFGYMYDSRIGGDAANAMAAASGARFEGASLQVGRESNNTSFTARREYGPAFPSRFSCKLVVQTGFPEMRFLSFLCRATGGRGQIRCHLAEKHFKKIKNLGLSSSLSHNGMD